MEDEAIVAFLAAAGLGSYQEIFTMLPEQDFIESQVWLKSYTEPWTEVLDRWTKTAPNPVFGFTKSNSVPTADILKDWPLFKHPLGYTLVSVDFKYMFPEKDLELLNGWPRYRDTLLSILRERSKNDKRSIVHQSLSSLPSEISEDGKHAVAMFFLPSLLQQGVIRQKGEKSWKPTIAEAQETFVMHAKDSPSVMIVGETLYTAKDFYVLFENVEYKMASGLAAVDTCFKILHVLNHEYPPESYNTWMFIQKFFYKLNVGSDKLSTCVRSLISEL